MHSLWLIRSLVNGLMSLSQVIKASSCNFLSVNAAATSTKFNSQNVSRSGEPPNVGRAYLLEDKLAGADSWAISGRI